MVKVHSKALDNHIEIERIIGKIRDKPGPSIIFMGGIHGNEPSGVFALKRVFDEIREKGYPVTGNIYAIAGNLWALERSERFHEEDLNRLWTKEQLEKLEEPDFISPNKDVDEQIAIQDIIRGILEDDDGPFYFMDLHTTSCETIPFMTVNDSLLNRDFTAQYPVPSVLGIEEYLDGPLLSYINELGYVAFGFEGGQHDDGAAIDNHVAFIFLSLAFSGILNQEDFDFYHHYEKLAKTSLESERTFEINFRHEIFEGDSFKMRPGYVNFQRIKKGEDLATSNGESIQSMKSGKIFMPLYQGRGNDGFFTIKKIPKIFLQLSRWVRKVRLDKFLALLPGVNWSSDKHEALIVNRTIARFLSKPIFHLMGYRSKTLDANHYLMKNRESASRNEDYRSTPWFKLD